jgi:hypothetical protein
MTSRTAVFFLTLGTVWYQEPYRTVQAHRYDIRKYGKPCLPQPEAVQNVDVNVINPEIKTVNRVLFMIWQTDGRLSEKISSILERWEKG